MPHVTVVVADEPQLPTTLFAVVTSITDEPFKLLALDVGGRVIVI
jgi:hypothetical protein